MTLTREQSTWLKLLAVIFMIIDHIGLVFFPEDMTWRIIGRLAFPLFAYQLAVGFEFTRNRRLQLKYLVLFALISQVPYTLVTDKLWSDLYFNVFGTFAIAYFFMMLCVRPNKIPFLIALAGYLLILPSTDYGLYGVFLPVGFYLLRKQPIGQVILLFLATFLKTYDGSALQIFAVFSVFLVLIISFLKMPSLPITKWFFYWFYPVHLALIAGIAWLL